jgi:hypothetical protein
MEADADEQAGHAAERSENRLAVHRERQEPDLARLPLETAHRRDEIDEAVDDLIAQFGIVLELLVSGTKVRELDVVEIGRLGADQNAIGVGRTDIA